MGVFPRIWFTFRHHPVLSQAIWPVCILFHVPFSCYNECRPKRDGDQARLIYTDGLTQMRPSSVHECVQSKKHDLGLDHEQVHQLASKI
jgi:hypothetical protein